MRVRIATLMLVSLLASGCASIAEDQRLNAMVETIEIGERRWDFARDGDYLYVRPSGLQSYVNDMRFKREVVAAPESYSGCRFTDPIWDESIISVWVVMGRLDCTP